MRCRTLARPLVCLWRCGPYPSRCARKLLDVSRLTALGWRPRISLEEGLRGIYGWYLEHGAARG